MRFPKQGPWQLLESKNKQDYIIEHFKSDSAERADMKREIIFPRFIF